MSIVFQVSRLYGKFSFGVLACSMIAFRLYCVWVVPISIVIWAGQVILPWCLPLVITLFIMVMCVLEICMRRKGGGVPVPFKVLVKGTSCFGEQAGHLILMSPTVVLWRLDPRRFWRHVSSVLARTIGLKGSVFVDEWLHFLLSHVSVIWVYRGDGGRWHPMWLM